MPYITRAGKLEYEDALASVGAGDGDLNYVLTKVALAWLMYHEPPYNYSQRAGVLLAFEAAKLEYYRRVVAPFEDRKREENGDVYPEEVLG